MDLTGQYNLELAVLAVMLRDEKLEWVELGKIDKDLFFHKENKALYEKILKLRLENAPYDLVLAKTSYGFTPDELTKIMPMLNCDIHPLNWIYLYNGLIEQYCKLTACDLQEGKITHKQYNELTEKYQKLNDKADLFNTQKNMAEYIDDVGNIIKQKLKTYHLGYDNLMETVGDLYEGNMIVVGGRTSMGKTSLMLKFAYNLAEKGEKVLFYTSEMNKTQLMNRIVSFVHSIKINKDFEKNKGDEKDLMRKLHDMAEKINITIADTSLFSEKEIAEKITETKATVLVLDYIQRFKLSNDCDSRAAEFSDIANNLKSLALNNKMLVIAGSQMNRAGDSRDLSALKESSGIEESCDLALLIARTKDNAGHEIKDTDFTKNITLHIAKNRNGQTGEVKFRFTKEYCDFTEC